MVKVDPMLVADGYQPPLVIGQECELEIPGGRTLRGKVDLWRQVDDLVIAVAMKADGGTVAFLLVRDLVDGVMRAEIPVEGADEIAVRQLLGLPVRMAVNEAANTMALRVLGGRR
jgi:hypothetical protein